MILTFRPVKARPDGWKLDLAASDPEDVAPEIAVVLDYGVTVQT